MWKSFDANILNYEYVSKSDILGPIDYLNDMRIWYCLEKLCLKITVSFNT